MHKHFGRKKSVQPELHFSQCTFSPDKLLKRKEDKFLPRLLELRGVEGVHLLFNILDIPQMLWADLVAICLN